MAPSPPVRAVAPSPPVPAAAQPPMAPPATAPPAAAPLAMAPPSTAPPAPWLQVEPSPMASMLGAQMYSEHTPSARVPLLSSAGDLITKGMAFHHDKVILIIKRAMEKPFISIYLYNIILISINLFALSQINYTASSVNRVLECPESSDAEDNSKEMLIFNSSSATCLRIISIVHHLY
ncbi:uncharacterized protein LOC120675202 isoform X1 [Panicum virgatum]|uniref:Uncharacterized protein n=1 Tax=Panicum virgatum TaxID=38727 RepID=A0A8T0RTY3_PANVG|nr:uncharacterized protein LOC120675202 isoform X1 [Panicum virgatum]KAG2589417.1 hypothetical protein PVAP13_5NG236100 [Panicum virgatum]